MTKMKSKAIVIIFGEGLNYKSGLGFFVPPLEVPFFGPSISTIQKEKNHWMDILRVAGSVKAMAGVFKWGLGVYIARLSEN